MVGDDLSNSPVRIFNVGVREFLIRLVIFSHFGRLYTFPAAYQQNRSLFFERISDKTAAEDHSQFVTTGFGMAPVLSWIQFRAK